ncbi:MAG: cyclic nucleotide-binding domain-containing protein [Nitrospirae bacterium]|nr:cyclic nucleotide-binding domain-containing protein [Nitrospirota bacterium]
MAKEQWETYFDAVKKEDWKTAKNILQLISKQEKHNPQTFVKIGDVCQRTGDKTEAIAAYTHAAQLLRMQGFAQKALATYKIALRLDPHNPEIIQRAEMLMDEFEAAKTAPHIPIQTSSSIEASGAVEELPLISEETVPAVVEVPETSDWLERTAVSPDTAEDKIITSDILPPDMTDMLESTSLTTEPPRPQEDLPPQVQEPATPEPGPSVEAIPFHTLGSQQAESPAPEQTEVPDESGDWLESAYEALDTKMFRPGAGKPSGEQTSRDDEAINLIYGQKPAVSNEDITEAMKELLTPLSERRERCIPEIFRDLPEEKVISFMNDLTVRKYQDKQHVIEEGDSGDSMFIIRSGRTRVVAHMLGRELELAVLGEGDIFGEVGFLTGRPRTAAVIADGAVEVHEISRLDIEKLIESNPEIIAKIEDFYETRVRDTIRKIKS